MTTSLAAPRAEWINGNAYAINEEDVEFPSCGTTLAGRFLRPEDGASSRPVLVMAPGMSGVKEGSIAQFSRFFAQGGFDVLAFDNINFGASGGAPRQEVDPHLQREGYRDAITYLALRGDVDAGRVGIWGTSFAGGNVLEVAARDRRVKCVVAQIPHISGSAVFRRRVQPLQRDKALRAQDADREARFRGEAPAMVKAVSDNPAEPVAMAGRPAWDYFTEQARQAPNWKNELTLRSLDNSRGLENGVWLPLISPTPLLMIVALADELVPHDVALAAYETALEPKKLVMLEGNHFSPYREDFEISSNMARDWFTRHLMTGGSAALL